MLALLALIAAACSSASSSDPATTGAESTTTVVGEVDDATVAPATTDRPLQRVTDGLAAFYELDDGDGVLVTDSIGGHDLTIADPDNVEWIDGALRIDAATVIAGAEPPTTLIDAVTTSGELTIEAWIETADLGQNGPARIVSISGDAENRNLTLGQGVSRGVGDLIDVRLRTTETDANGRPSLASPEGTLTTALTQVAFTRASDGTTRLYLDGVMQVSGRAAGDLSSWDDGYRLLLANEADGQRPWLGTLHLVAVYDRALTDDEIARNHQASAGSGRSDGEGIDQGDDSAASPTDDGGSDAPRITGGTFLGSGWIRLSTETGDLPAPPDQPDQTVAVIADLDGDGADDIVLGGRRGEVGPSLVWYSFDADDGNWVRRTIEDELLRLEAGGAAGDLDGDGDLDLVIGEDLRGERLFWWENPAPDLDGRWVRREIKSEGSRQHHDQVIGDVDGDGRDEVVFWNQGARGRLLLAEIPSQPTIEPWPTEVIYSPEDISEGLAIADIDLDGVDDIIGGGYWLRHEAGVDFTASPIDATRPDTQVSVGQLIEGGRPEVVLDSGDFEGELTMYEWDGAAWRGTTLDPDSRRGHSSDVADVDGDGHLDILSGEMGIEGVDDPEVKVFYGDGTGGFTEEIVEVGRAIHDSGFGDVNGDGWIDIVGKPFDLGAPRLDVWLNARGVDPVETADGSSFGTWSRAVADDDVPWRTIFVEHGDIDGDGREDLVSGGWWWRNPGTIDGTWTRSTIGAPMNQMAVVADLDGDGDLDVLGTAAEGSRPNAELSWAENDGSGNFTVRTNIEDADGRFLQGAVAVELVPGRLEVALSWENGTAGLQMLTVPDGTAIRTDTWAWRSAHPTVFGEALSAGDIDGDGDIDLFDGQAWFRNADGDLTRIEIQELPGEPDRNVLRDVDGDGDLDAIVTFGHDADGKIRWFRQPDDPEAPWAENDIDDVGPLEALSLDSDDLDGDGDLDIVIGEHANPDTGELALVVYEQAPGGWTRHVVSAGDEHHDGTQLFDADGDGDLDVVSIGWTHRRLLLFENPAD